MDIHQDIWYAVYLEIGKERSPVYVAGYGECNHWIEWAREAAPRHGWRAEADQDYDASYFTKGDASFTLLVGDWADMPDTQPTLGYQVSPDAEKAAAHRLFQEAEKHFGLT